MLPVLFTLTVPAELVMPLALAALAAVAVARAWAFRRRMAETKKQVGWGAALWDDRWTLGALAAGLALLWRAGILEGELALPLHTYGLLIATGFIVAIALAQREARRQGQEVDRIGDLAFWVLLAALAGSRLFFIVVNWNDYFGDNAWLVFHGARIPRLLALWEGGLVFYGGFIAAALTTWWYIRRAKLPFLPYADTLIPSVSVGHFFGRLGCFAAGCCWGRVSDAHLPWLARFPPASLAYQSFAARPNAAELLSPDRLTTRPVHPTQLYESLGELALYAVLAFLVRPAKRFHGQVLAIWLMAYAVLRTTVEFFRGDVERGVILGLGVGQWTSAAIFAAGVSVWAIGRKRGQLPRETRRRKRVAA
jgi:phosphatidylglycerol---prolipoprotein diacylglyceryl transferase